MVSFKWDDNLAREIAVEESREEGLQEGLEKGLQKGLEKGLQKGLKKGREEGKVPAVLEMAVKLLKKSYPLSDVADITDLSPEEVREIAKKNGLVC